MRRTWTLRTERPVAGFEPRTSLLCPGTVLTTKLPVNNQRADWSPETAAAHVALQQHSPYTERACKSEGLGEWERGGERKSVPVGAVTNTQVQLQHLDIWWAVSLCLVCVLILFEPEFIWPHYVAQSFIIWLKKIFFTALKLACGFLLFSCSAAGYSLAAGRFQWCNAA